MIQHSCIPEEYFDKEYSEIYVGDELVGSVNISDALTENCTITLYLVNSNYKFFFVNIEEGKVINYGVSEQLN